jgi:hypothetical protein
MTRGKTDQETWMAKNSAIEARVTLVPLENGTGIISADKFGLNSGALTSVKTAQLRKNLRAQGYLLDERQPSYDQYTIERMVLGKKYR